MDGENGSQNGSANGDAKGSPSVHIPKPGAKQNLPQNLIRDPFFVAPHVSTYAGQYNVVNKSYYIYWDEALRNSQANTLAFRRDGLVQELIRHRQMPVISLPHHIEVDDPEHPDQISISETIHKIFSNIPRLKSMMTYLSEATFYGRYGAQIQLGPRRVAGNTWNSIVRHIPINGDKFRYKWDGTPGISIYEGAQSKDSILGESNAYLIKYAKDVEQTMLGPALFLREQFLRDRFVIHNFEPFDTDYLFEIDESQSVFGLGLRSRLYWTWNLRTEILSWMVDALQRVGANGMIYGFAQSGNIQAQNEVLSALKQLVKDNLTVFPLPPGNKDQLKDMIQRIEPSAVGYDVMFQLVEHFEGIMRRAFLGQDLSSKSSPTGYGKGASDLQGEVRQDYIKYDSDNMAETLTEDVIDVIIRYNDWKYEGKKVKGPDLPFSMRLVFDIDKGDGPQRLEAAEKAFNMGVKLDEDDVLKAAGFSPPKKQSRILVNHGLEQQKQMNEAGQPQFNELNKHMKGLVDSGKQAQGMGMLGGNGGIKSSGMGGTKPSGASRFARPKDAYILHGRFHVSQSGWGLLSVPNDLVYGLFDAMNETGIDLPPQSDHSKMKLNAHISVFTKEEITKIGPENIAERGHSFHYNIGPIKEVKPTGWKEMSKVWFVDVDSPELEDLRESYGLSRLPENGKHRFHISAAVRKKKRSKFSKEFDEGEDQIPASTKVLDRDQVRDILSNQYFNKGKNTDSDKWLESQRYDLHKNMPIWPFSAFKFHPASDPSHSTGPIIVDGNAMGDGRHNGSFGSNNRFRIVDGKHRLFDAIRAGETHLDAFIGDKIYYELMKYIEEFGPKRERFVKALDRYYTDSEDYKAQEELIESGNHCGLDSDQLNKLVKNERRGIHFDVDLGMYKNSGKKSRFAHAGDADDCGHERKGGKFSEGNICAGEGGKSENDRKNRKKQLAKARKDIHSKTAKLRSKHRKEHAKLKQQQFNKGVDRLQAKGQRMELAEVHRKERQAALEKIKAEIYATVGKPGNKSESFRKAKVKPLAELRAKQIKERKEVIAEQKGEWEALTKEHKKERKKFVSDAREAREQLRQEYKEERANLVASKREEHRGEIKSAIQDFRKRERVAGKMIEEAITAADSARALKIAKRLDEIEEEHLASLKETEETNRQSLVEEIDYIKEQYKEAVENHKEEIADEWKVQRREHHDEYRNLHKEHQEARDGVREAEKTERKEVVDEIRDAMRPDAIERLNERQEGERRHHEEFHDPKRRAKIRQYYERDSAKEISAKKALGEDTAEIESKHKRAFDEFDSAKERHEREMDELHERQRNRLESLLSNIKHK